MKTRTANKEETKTVVRSYDVGSTDTLTFSVPPGAEVVFITVKDITGNAAFVGMGIEGLTDLAAAASRAAHQLAVNRSEAMLASMLASARKETI
jgi:hypothetical protein